MIVKDNEAVVHRVHKPTIIYNDTWMIEKNSYFSMRQQHINCHAHLSEPNHKAMACIEALIEQAEGKNLSPKIDIDVK